MDVERAKVFEDRFPQGVLERLRPYGADIGEVVRWTADFPHQKYHILDTLLHMRHYDSEAREAQVTMDSMDWEDRQKYPLWTDWWDLDLITYDRIERALRLHDTGMYFVENGILKPDEHHFGSLFVAMHLDGDPIVWDAVFNHIQDVLPENASKVDRYVRDLDRLVGAGYVGLIRLATYQGFEHPELKERDEDKVVADGVMMAIPDRFGKPGELKAEKFFWDSVFPYFESQGPEGMRVLGTLSKTMLDRIVGRDYRDLNREQTSFEKDVLEFDYNSLVVEEVMSRLRNTFGCKVQNTLEVLIRTRGGKSSSDVWNTLTVDELEKYYHAW